MKIRIIKLFIILAAAIATLAPIRTSAGSSITGKSVKKIIKDTAKYQLGARKVKYVGEKKASEKVIEKNARKKIIVVEHFKATVKTIWGLAKSPKGRFYLPIDKDLRFWRIGAKVHVYKVYNFYGDLYETVFSYSKKAVW